MLVTAELPPPGGQSTAARNLVVDWGGPADLAALTTAQRDDAPFYGQTLAAYLQWMAPRYEALRDDLPAHLARLRDEFPRRGSLSHGRVAENAAKLTLGALVFLRFAVECGALASEDALAQAEDAANAVLACACRTNEDQAERKPTSIFFEFLGAMLAQGAAFLPSIDGTPPEQAELFGYVRSDPAGFGTRPGAEKVGWASGFGGEAYLLPAAAFRAVAHYAQAANVRLPVTQRALAEHLARDGYLLRTGGDRKEVPFRAEGRGGLRGWCVRADVLTDGVAVQGSGNTGNSGSRPEGSHEPRRRWRSAVLPVLLPGGNTTGNTPDPGVPERGPVADRVAGSTGERQRDGVPEPAPLLGPAAPTAAVTGPDAPKAPAASQSARVKVEL